VRRFLIQFLLPLCICLFPLLGAGVVAVAIPPDAMNYYLKNFTLMDALILSLGSVLFFFQVILSWRSLQWRGTRFDERPDRWVSNLAQAAEWFPILGLLGTVGGILQTFSSITGPVQPQVIIEKYAPAITATGSGLYMAFINILPPWLILLGRDLIGTLSGSRSSGESS
jgi:hypothetical protein